MSANDEYEYTRDQVEERLTTHWNDAVWETTSATSPAGAGEEGRKAKDESGEG